ncbi:MAG: ASKHA domain-containing protein [Clostridia bacterium]
MYMLLSTPESSYEEGHRVKPMSNSYSILFLPENIRVTANEGASIYDVARICDVMSDAFCGGNGTCGKCMVDVTINGKTVSQKACLTYVDSDMIVRIPKAGKAAILTTGFDRQVPFAPSCQIVSVQLNNPDIGDERSEWELFCAAAQLDASIQPPLPLVSKLYHLRRQTGGQLFATLLGGQLIDLSATSPHPYLCAFDIGTTTIVCYLLDGLSGKQKAVSSMLNPQTSFGADVIARSNYAMEHGGNDLQSSVVSAMNALIDEVCGIANIQHTDINQCTVVCNTCMHHLLLGLSPASLVHAPYNPVIRQAVCVRADSLGLTIHQNGQIQLLPNIAGFVGSDTVGCLVATDFPSFSGTSLIIDIGTNGELVLGNRQRRIACSTAAGPAFEGALIHCGMRGTVGAIDHVWLENGLLSYSVIGGCKPVGICGSGLVDLIAQLLACGTVDSSGCIDCDGAFSDRIVEVDGKPAIVIVDTLNSANGTAIVLTQKDIREMQLAKAAMAAGIRLMANTIGIPLENIDRVLIAGAFGNYLDARSACGIGLLPAILSSRIQSIGNAAGEGAKICTLNAALYEESKQLAAGTTFLELATRVDFQDCFVEELAFPEKENP